MIERYSLPEMARIWEEENKYRTWFLIEKSACEAMVKIGIVPESVLKGLHSMGDKFNVCRIHEIEKEVKHDVIAFLTYIAESANADIRYLHYGMTSSDVLDTCLSIQLKQSCDVLLGNINDLLAVLKKLALATRYLKCAGRSHGVHAEPITFGLRFARFYAEFERQKHRLITAKEEVSVCKMSGAMGNFAHLDPFVERYVAETLELTPDAASSQVISRDRHAAFFACLGNIAASVENVATEIRLLQQTEVSEVAEPFSSGQKGSSAMPHKRNPILSENLTGLSRVIRSYVAPALENVVLWYERDISHSSVERFIAPDACVTLNFALVRLTHILENLEINEDKVADNLNNASLGMMLSQKVLLSLVDAGMSRENAYKVLQDCTALSLRDQSNFIANVRQHPTVAELLHTDALDNLASLDCYSKHVDFIFHRVFGSST